MATRQLLNTFCSCQMKGIYKNKNEKKQGKIYEESEGEGASQKYFHFHQFPRFFNILDLIYCRTISTLI